MKKRLKINGAIMACSALVIIIFPKLFLRVDSGGTGEEILEALFFGLIMLGQIIRVSARGYKAEHSQDSQALIQGGPYQVVRNPMYLGIFLIGLGVARAIFKWWAVTFFIVVFIIRYVVLIYKEEKKLLAIFPQEYPQYCRKVPRLFPALSTIIKLDIVEYLPIKISWFKKEIGSMITLLLVVLLIESWEDIVTKGPKVFFQQSVWLFSSFVLFAAFVILLSKHTYKKNEYSTDKG